MLTAKKSKDLDDKQRKGPYKISISTFLVELYLDVVSRLSCGWDWNFLLTKLVDKCHRKIHRIKIIVFTL